MNKYIKATGGILLAWLLMGIVIMLGQAVWLLQGHTIFGYKFDVFSLKYIYYIIGFSLSLILISLLVVMAIYKIKGKSLIDDDDDENENKKKKIII